MSAKAIGTVVPFAPADLGSFSSNEEILVKIYSPNILWKFVKIANLGFLALNILRVLSNERFFNKGLNFLITILWQHFQYKNVFQYGKFSQG